MRMPHNCRTIVANHKNAALGRVETWERESGREVGEDEHEKGLMVTVMVVVMVMVMVMVVVVVVTIS